MAVHLTSPEIGISGRGRLAAAFAFSMGENNLMAIPQRHAFACRQTLCLTPASVGMVLAGASKRREEGRPVKRIAPAVRRRLSSSRRALVDGWSVWCLWSRFFVARQDHRRGWRNPTRSGGLMFTTIAFGFGLNSNIGPLLRPFLSGEKEWRYQLLLIVGTYPNCRVLFFRYC